MAGDVKAARPDRGVVRQARTRRTRAAVVEAARTLFLERGYGATTIEAISDLSDTPQATVYRLFSSKLGILRALLEVSVTGDDEGVPLQDRPHVRALVADPDPRSQLSGFAAITRGIMSRTEPIPGRPGNVRIDSALGARHLRASSVQHSRFGSITLDSRVALSVR